MDVPMAEAPEPLGVVDPSASARRMAGLVVELDQDCEADNHPSGELALAWARHGWQTLERRPLSVARASVVDLRSPARAPPAEELRALLAAAARRLPVPTAPQSMAFIQRLLPGEVATDPEDGTPVSAQNHAMKVLGTGEPRPYVELARKHVVDADNKLRGLQGTTAEDYNPAYSPVTTKAGGRIWSLYFAAHGGKVQALHASYPCQILVRYDPLWQCLIFDAFEFKPASYGVFRRRVDAALADNASEADIAAVASTAELQDVSSAVARTRKKRLKDGNVFAKALEGCKNDTAEDVLAHPGHGSSDLDKIHAFADKADALCQLVNHAQWKRSACWRVRVGMEKLTAARVVSLDARRPNGELPLPDEGRGLKRLGKPSAASSSISDTEGLKGKDRNVRVAVGLRATGAELEGTALLVLDYSDGADAEFAKTTIVNASNEMNLREPVQDWTPGEIATDAVRHYVVGDEKEIAELVAFLCVKEPSFKALIEKPVVGGVESIDPAKLPENKRNVAGLEGSSDAPSPLGALLFRELLPPDVVARIKTLSEPLVFETTSEVHEFLRSAGVEEVMDDVNPCLKAGLLNGAISVDATQKPEDWLDIKLHTGKCNSCNGELICTARDALIQPAWGGYDYQEGNGEGAIICDNADCDGAYITNLCSSAAARGFVSGKFHNHCTECPDFGVCLGDYRDAHCDRCDDHYYAGGMDPRCDCVDREEMSIEEVVYASDFLGPNSDSEGDGSGPAGSTPLQGPPSGAFDGLLVDIDRAEHDSLLRKAVDDFVGATASSRVLGGV